MADGTANHGERFSWRTMFARSRTAVFVIDGQRRLRYANPAWEEATGASWAKYRGVRVSVRAGSNTLPRSLAPPSEVWKGSTARLRRVAPGESLGPPWWDLEFVPLAGDGSVLPLGILGLLHVVDSKEASSAGLLPEAIGRLRKAANDRFGFDWLEGESAATQRLASQIRAAAPSDQPVWLHGERGTGKRTLARILHANGPKRALAFVALEGGAIADDVVEASIFGKGGLASGRYVGTLYLTEPQRFSPRLQDRLIGWVASAGGPRIACGSAELARVAVAARTLHPHFDLRFSALPMNVPPLRERCDDWPRLLARWLVTSIDDEATSLLKAYPWPGNFREARSIVESLPKEPIGREHLPRRLQEVSLIAAPSAPKPLPSLDELLAEVESRMLDVALHRVDGRPGPAAKLLGITRTRLNALMARHRRKPSEGES